MIGPSCHCPTSPSPTSSPSPLFASQPTSSQSTLSPTSSSSIKRQSITTISAKMASYTSQNPPTTNPNSSTTTAQQSIPSHPAPSDAAAVSSGVPADAATTSDTANGRKNSAAAKHAQEHAHGWKPNLDRRQSWNKEDQKRALQMSGIKDEGA